MLKPSRTVPGVLAKAGISSGQLLASCSLALLAAVTLAVPAAAESVTLPPPVSPNGQRIADLYNVITIFAIPIFLLVEGLLLVIVIRFRRRRADQIPPQFHGNNRLEVVWTVIPLAIVLIIGAISYQELQRDFVKQGNAQTMEVTVVGKQFNWEYQYQVPGRDGKPFTTQNTLYAPSHRTVRLKFQSVDVIHSWWVPAITGKTDAVPGYENYSWLNITAPSDCPAQGPGGEPLQDPKDPTRFNTPCHWHGECAELCGAGHADMQIDVVAVDDWDTWVRQQTSPPASPKVSTVPSPLQTASPKPTPS